MIFWKRLLNALLFPHAVIVGILVPVASGLLTYAFVEASEYSMISFVAYGISFYTLMVVCFRMPAIIRFGRHLKNENKYVVRYLSDVRLRIRLSLGIGFLSSAAYAVFQMVLGAYHASIWFYAMAVYYFLLATVRYFLFHHAQTNRPGEGMLGELQLSRFCGICLLCMNVAMAVIIFYITWQNRTFHHHPITTIAMAAYTFFAFTMAIINLVKYRKYKSPVYSSAKMLSFISASVSMLTLETAMLTAFDERNDLVFRQWMTGLTGTAVSVLILGMAIYMIQRANRQLKEWKRNEE